MNRRLILLAAALAFGVVTTTFGASQVSTSLAERTKGAELVVRGHVVGVRAAFKVNEFGDNLIISTVQVAVDEVYKGKPSGQVELEVEGGTVGRLTLKVSDQPELAAGEDCVFFLKRNKGGVLTPHLRGQGVLKLDRNGHVVGTDISGDEVRQAVRNAQAQNR